MKKRIGLGAVLATMVLGITGCSTDFKSHTIELNTVYDGETLDLCTNVVRDYLNLEDPDEIAEYLAGYSESKQDFMSIKFSWRMDDSEVYTVHFSETKDFKEEVTYETDSNTLLNKGVFVPGKTYYWKVTGDAEGSDSKVDWFKTLDAPVRYITLEEGFNVRDLGGWKTEDGKKVKYGMIYRGGKVNNHGGNEGLSEEDQRVFRKLLNIRGELDLRITNQDDDGQTESVFGRSVAYRKTPMQGYNYVIPGFKQETPMPRECPAEFVESVGYAFHFLADENNYPLYFHCNAGADRTGTISFLLNGLLGVSEEDLTRDFELTSFSPGGKRWRSNILGGKFTEDGVMQDDAGNYVAWGKMVQQIKDQYGTEGGKLSDAIKNYLMTECNIKETEIQNIKKMLLE